MENELDLGWFIFGPWFDLKEKIIPIIYSKEPVSNVFPVL